MANIKDVREILTHTPIEQALMFIGGHGIGKSKLIEQLAKDDDAEFITLFLGQAADAGDIIGLPTRIEHTDDDGNSYFITDFAPPKWWPRNMGKKYYLFLDEFNRMKPEMGQCVMDLVLNRKLNGRNLPSNTRIIAAINPLEDGYYQVEELDPALMDRFNVYEFNPTVGEWLDWAMITDIHPAVIGFIAGHHSLLDPPSAKEAKAGQVYPSRRSWERVSKILSGNAKIIEHQKILQNILMGIIGVGAASEFCKYIKTLGSGLNAGIVLTKWDKKIEEKVKILDQQGQVHLISEIVYWFDQNAEDLKKDKDHAMKIVLNLKCFLDAATAETSAMFFGKMREDFEKKKKLWTQIVAADKNLAEKFIEIIRSK